MALHRLDVRTSGSEVSLDQRVPVNFERMDRLVVCVGDGILELGHPGQFLNPLPQSPTFTRCPRQTPSTRQTPLECCHRDTEFELVAAAVRLVCRRRAVFPVVRRVHIRATVDDARIDRLNVLLGLRPSADCGRARDQHSKALIDVGMNRGCRCDQDERTPQQYRP